MALNSMGAPSFAPVRQDSQVIRTDAEYEVMRRNAERKALEAGRIARKEAQQASGYNDYANRFKAAPSVAEIMAQTGATSKQAVDIRRYQDWDNYAPEGGWAKGGLETAQANLANPNRVAPEFDWKWTQPEQAGSILPSYKDYGDGTKSANSLILRDSTGDTVGSLGYGFGKDRLYQEAMGLGLGQGALDEFARNNGAADWNSLSWSGDVNQDAARWSTGQWGNGDYLGNANTRRGNPDLWGGSYAVRTENGPTTYNPDGSVVEYKDTIDYQQMQSRDKWFDAMKLSGQARQNVGAMNADFGASMDQRNQQGIRNQQGYASLLGNGQTGGLFGQNYSDPFFGQITGREAQQSPFTMSQQGPYPWSPSPTQQLDVSSLLTPSYGGPGGGSGSMGSYGGKTGGLGGLGGSQMGSSPWGGPIGARNPWSPS